MSLKISINNTPDRTRVLSPESLEEAKVIIEYLQQTIRNKDARFIELSKSEEALRRENALLYQRIEQLKGFLLKAGMNVA